MEFLFLFFLYFLPVVLLVPVFRVLAVRFGMVDRPGGRKDHHGDIPLIGGLTIFSVFLVNFYLGGYELAEYWYIYSALSLLLVTGAVDDKVHLHSWTKFGVQLVATILVVVPGGAQIHQLGDLFGFGDFGLGFMALPFSIACVMLIINAVNLMDGLDGLAGGTSFVILSMMFVVAFGVVPETGLVPLLGLIAAVAGFLIYNMRSPFRKKASIFLGDAGSMSLGLMIAWFAITLSSQDVGVIEPMAVAWLLAVPVWDECAQFYRRVREGRHPFSPDRGHFHHHFIEAGFTPGWAVLFILAIVLLTGAFGVWGSALGVPLPVLTLLWIAGLLAHMFYSRDLKKYPKLIKRFCRP